MPTHGTALNEGQTAEFVGAGTKALILIANHLGPDLAGNWAQNGEAMQRAFLGALMPPEEKPAPAVIEVPQPTITVYPISVDYGMKFEAMVKAGRYDWTNSDITAEHFPVKGEGAVELKAQAQLVHFGRDMDDGDVTRELDALGFRDGAIEELLAFGAKYPDLLREFPIVARKSVWQDRFGCSHCPYLSRGGGGRGLGLYLREGRWSGYCRFLAFGK